MAADDLPCEPRRMLPVPAAIPDGLPEGHRAHVVSGAVDTLECLTLNHAAHGGVPRKRSGPGASVRRTGAPSRRGFGGAARKAPGQPRGSGGRLASVHLRPGAMSAGTTPCRRSASGRGSPRSRLAARAAAPAALWMP